MIRIVPLHVPEGVLAPAAGPHLSYRGGQLITNVEVFTLFWGNAWQGAQAALAKSLNSSSTSSSPAR